MTDASPFTTLHLGRFLATSGLAFAGFVVAWVPSFGDEWPWPALLAVAAYAAVTRKWREALSLLAYVLPLFLNLLWPTHCFTAAAVWVLAGASRSAAAGNAIAARRDLVFSRLVVAALAGVIAGGIVVLLDFHALVDEPWWLPIQRPPTWMIVAVVILATVVNAIGEELWWRHLLIGLHATQPVPVGYLFQALTFGLAHVHGIPSGPVGVVAAAIFSIACVRVFLRWGWVACVVLHLATDLVVFSAVAITTTYAFW
jgi:hypothetical protein